MSSAQASARDPRSTLAERTEMHHSERTLAEALNQYLSSLIQSEAGS